MAAEVIAFNILVILSDAEGGVEWISVGYCGLKDCTVPIA
ncbi:hypothetical protein QO008_001552 [Peptoniphilus ivorii]|nr:hypothetical protein [Peptoniphilus ivorii]